MKVTITALTSLLNRYARRISSPYAFLLCIAMSVNVDINAQCTGSAQYGSCTLPTTVGTQVQATSCQYAMEYWPAFSPIVGYSYEFSSSVSTDYITVRIGSVNGAVLGAGQTPLTVTATSTTTLYVAIHLNSSCGTQVGCRNGYAKLVGIPCSGQPTAGAASASKTTYLCTGGTPTLSLPNGTVSSNSQVQWQSRAVGTTAWSNLGSQLTGTASYTLPTAITQNTQFRAWLRCPTSNLTDTSSAVTVNLVVSAITPATTTSVCTPPASQVLTLTAPSIPDTIVKEDFNSSAHSFTTTFGGGGQGWQITQNNYTWPTLGWTFSNSNGSSFLMTNAYYNYGGFNWAISPSFSTVGYTSISLNFRQGFNLNGYCSNLEISTNGGSSWTLLTNYCTNQGSYNNFTSTTVSLNSYLNQPNVKIRWGFYAYYGYSWALDDFSITGGHPDPEYSWTASPSTGAGLPSGAGTPSASNTSITVTPTVTGSITYTGTIVNMAPGCVTTKQVALNVNPKPSATLALTDQSICNGGATNLSLNILTGIPPFTLTYTDGVTPVTMTTTNTTVNIPINPNSDKTYKITALSDPNCIAGAAQIPDSVTLTVHPRPTAAMNNQTYQICDGTTAMLPVTLTGTPPFSITYYDGTSYTTLNNIMTNSYLMPVPTAIGTTNYSITNLSDFNCAALPGDITGSNTVMGYVRPTASLTGSPTICNGSFGNLQVTLTGAPPYSFTYGDGGSFTYSVSNIVSNPYTLTVTPSMTSTFAITAVNDQNCASLPVDITGSSLVTVNPRPTAMMVNSPQTICHGTPVNLTVQLTGTPPFNLMYTNGQGSGVVGPINTNTYTFSTTPQSTGSYTVSALNDASCVSLPQDLMGSNLVTVNHPVATLSGNQVSCSGGSANMEVDFSGPGATPPYTFTYSDGNQTNTVTTTSDPYALTVNTTGSSTFVLTNFNDANCLGDVAGNAIIIANPMGGWNGMTSSDWQNPANWCGGVPTATTNVLIPAVAPNMPVLATGNGFTNNLTVEPGATMTILNGANYFLYGNMVNNGNLNWNAGNVSMNGSTAQTVDGFTCQNLFINNMDGVTPTQDVIVNAILQMSGNIYLNNTDLIMNSGSQIIGHEPTQYIHTMSTGTLKREVSVTGVEFPVGLSSYNPVVLSNMGVPDEFAVRVFDAVYEDGDGTTNSATVTWPTVNRTWMIGEKNAGGSLVSISPVWYNHVAEEINLFDRAHVYMKHLTGAVWTYDVNDSTNAGAAANYQTFGPYSHTDGGYTNFSPFTVGAWNLWPLSIELLDFTAQLQDNTSALLNWQVSQSSDAGLFEIEHGTDGANFTKIGEVSAVANKTGYSNIHRGLAEGRNYYRLKVTDENGKSAYSKIAVVVTKGMVVDVISLAPNPVTGVSVVTVSADDANSAEVRVLDAVGRVLLSSKHSLAQGMNNISLDMSSLAQGNYTLQVITDAGNSTPVKFTKL